MGFKIGRFDSKFGITKEAFIEEVNNAAQMWANEVGKPVFTYNSQGPLTINLIYDERQARTDSANNLSLEIENSKAHADQLKSIYEKEKEVYIGDTKQLTKDMNAFKERYKVYTDKVTMYNNRGGAQQEEYDAMTKELEFLKQLSKELNSRRDSLIAYRDTINAKVNRYNELVTYINELIEKSNALGGNSFTEGRFTPYSNTIDIYQYNDLVKLRRVIAHELGHVIGIRHVENVASIMYSMNSATTTVLSAQDAAALKSACAQ
jgi:hypothetical protein